MSEDQFVLAYDGPALRDHEMDVADLASGLLALSSSFKRAQQVVSPGAPAASLNARATTAGSFEVTMAVIQPGMIGSLFDSLNGGGVTATLNASGLAGIAWGAWRLIKRLAGGRFRSVTPAERPGQVTVTFPDGTTLTCDERSVLLARDLDFRRHVERVVAPVDGEGVTSLALREDDAEHAEILSVSSDEALWFAAPQLPEEEPVSSEERVTVVQPVGVEFDWHKWRVTEGAGVMPVTVDDDAFRTQVERQEVTLGANDLLRVRLRTDQYRSRAGDLKARNTIVSVIEHTPGARQDPLEFDR